MPNEGVGSTLKRMVTVHWMIGIKVINERTLLGVYEVEFSTS